ncbi:hypothetical protein ZWY2020_027339 [Hordeum vulgare]|nr:hypothetical protein ZWY2020_027339 [Hordeum vulgare]
MARPRSPPPSPRSDQARSCFELVLPKAGSTKAAAFDEIDKAPEEKARGITISTVGVPSLVCFLNKVDALEDEELLELVEMDFRVMLVFYE